MLNGFLNINKESGMTSNDVIYQIKKIFYPMKIKIGHTGTLDPMATGVLPIALGEATKTIQFQIEGKKIYEFNVKFGTSTETDDKEGEIIKTSSLIPILKQINDILPNFIGEIEQTPPKYSAIKINGNRAYKLAREGKDFEISPRKNYIHSLKLIKQINDKEFQFEVCANKGFYVRSLGRDIGLYLNTCSHITYLNRIRNGNFDIKESITLDKLRKKMENNEKSLDVRECIGDLLLPISYGLNDILVLDITKEQCEKLRNGINLPTKIFQNIRENSFYQVHYNSTLQAIVKSTNNYLKIIRIFNL